MPDQVFLSYGRADAADLAKAVAEHLEALGYAVWRDRPRLRAGQPFLEKIEQAIRDSVAVVAVLSPHSVRRTSDSEALDSVCLDELSFARFSTPPRPIVPVMAVPCEPPMVIYRLQYVDMTAEGERDDGLARLAEALEAALAGEVRYRSWVHSLNSWDFEPFLREKRRGFVGRDWLHARVGDWLDGDTREPALLVTGDPGCGKSAFVASLVEHNDRRLLAYHCCQANTRETTKPGRFVRSVAAMIASRMPAYADRLTAGLESVLDEAACEADPSSAFEAGILAPLAALPAPQWGPSYLLIDALDEALAQEQGGGATIVELLSDRLDRFPPWLRVVATSRNEASVLRRLLGIRHVALDVTSADNLADVEAYVRLRAESGELSNALGPDGSRLEDLVEGMRGAGNFLFVREALNALARGQATLEDVDALPGGLYGIYESFFERTFPRSEDPEVLACAKALLGVVLAAQEPMNEAMLAATTKLDPDEALPRTLKRLAPYLPASEDEGGERHYAVYHKSFADWLQDRELLGTRASVPAGPGHRALARRFEEIRARGVDRLPPYFLAYGPLHLARAGERESLVDLLTDAVFVLRFQRELGPARLLEAYETARASADEAVEAEIEAIARALRLALPALVRSPAEFEIQVEARLREVATLAEFRDALRSASPSQVLIPETTPLSPAGGALLLPLRSGFAINAVWVDERARLVATGNEEEDIRVYRLSDGEPVQSVHLDGASFSCAVGDPAHSVAAFGTFGGEIVRFDLTTGEHDVCEAHAHGHVRDLCFDGAGASLYSAHEHAIVCWSWPSLTCRWQRTFDEEELWGLRVTEDGERIFLATSAHVLELPHEGAPTVLRDAPVNPGAEPWDEIKVHRYFELALREDGLLAAGREDGRIELIAPAGVDAVTELPGHPLEFYTAGIQGLAFVGTDRLVSAGRDDAIRVWDVATGRELRSVRGASSVSALTVFDDGRRAFSGHKMLSANLWDLEGTGRVAGEPAFANGIRVDESLGVAVAKIGLRRAAVWELANGVRRELDFDERVVCVGLDGARRQVLVVVESGILAIDLAKLDHGEKIETLELAHHDDASFSPDGRVLVFESYPGAGIWRRGQGVSMLAKRCETIFALAVSNACAAIAGSDEVVLHDLSQDDGEVRRVELSASANCCALSPNGGTLAVGDGGGQVHLFDTSGERPETTLEAASQWVLALYVTDSGALCVIGDDDVTLFDTATARAVGQLHSENRWGDCWVSEDAQCVLVGGAEGSLHVLRRKAGMG